MVGARFSTTPICSSMLLASRGGIPSLVPLPCVLMEREHLSHAIPWTSTFPASLVTQKGERIVTLGPPAVSVCL